MPNVLVNDEYLSDIADAIRAKNGSSDTYTPGQMAGAISGIPYGSPQVNFNWVRNADFRNPSNSRGDTTYGSTVGDNATIDGWHNYAQNGGSSITLISNQGLRIQKTASGNLNLYQTIKCGPLTVFNNKDIILSALVDGVLYTSQVNTGVSTGTITYIDTGDIYVSFNRDSGAVLAISINKGATDSAIDVIVTGVKVELGSAQTLASGSPGNWVMLDPPIAPDMELYLVNYLTNSK